MQTALNSSSYNNLNQKTNQSPGGILQVQGALNGAANVTVNGAAADRKIEYFQGTVGTNNASSPAWLNTIVSGAGNSVTGHVYVAQTPEHFQYDADGNLTNDGRWAYTWDAENRLVGMTVNTNVGPQYQLTFAFDFQGRRIQKIVATNGVTYATNNFIYDGWNLIAETAPNNSLIRNYVWGSDLSGSAQGAGGVGGLLEVSYHGASTTNAFVAYDGNGNVSALVNAADGAMLANYEYSPFGETIRSTGLLAKNNPFRFSTKYQDDESDQIYYGYRYYKPSSGNWLSRDPSEEAGGPNVYCFDSDDSIGQIDGLGLDEVTVSADAFIPWEWVQLPSPGPYYLQIKGDGRLPGSSPPSIASHNYRMANTITVELLGGSSPGPIVSLDMGISTSTRRLVDSSGKVINSYTHAAHLLSFTTDAKRLSCNSVEVDLQMSGKVDWRVAGPQPAIDYAYKVILTQNGKDISWDLTADHDGFPAHEFFLQASGSTVANRNYVPYWFTSVPPGSGTVGKPDVYHMLLGTSALAGIYMHQHYTDHNTFTLP